MLNRKRNTATVLGRGIFVVVTLMASALQKKSCTTSNVLVGVTGFSSSSAPVLVRHQLQLLAQTSNDRDTGSDNSTRDRSSSSSTTTPNYSRELYLREEIESPFRKVRFFVYASLAGGAATSLAVSLARVAAASFAGINTDLQSESLVNVGVDVAGLLVLAVLFKRDMDAQESRLQRASKGAALAKLRIRGSKRWMMIPESDTEGVNLSAAGSSSGIEAAWTTSLSSLRRGRGMEKRVVIAVGGRNRIDQAVQDALRLQDSLVASDLLVVPVLLPQGLAPDSLDASQLPECLALPVGNSWKSIVQDEAEQAKLQGVDVPEEGFCIILKKNGKIGQRTKGINLSRMAGEVEERKEMGLDVTNI